MIEFDVPDMSCNHCVQVITRTVKQVDDQAALKVDLASRKVQIESAKPAGEFAAALAEEGYPPA